MFDFITFMHTFRHLICLVFFITFLACNPPITNKIDIKATIRQVDSLTFTNDTAAYKDNLLKASSLLKGAISQEPNNNLVRQLQITTYTLMRTPDSVLLVYQDWVKREPNSLQANLRRGLLYHVCKDEQKAKLDFKKVKLMLIGNMKLLNKETNDRDLNLQGLRSLTAEVIYLVKR